MLDNSLSDFREKKSLPFFINNICNLYHILDSHSEVKYRSNSNAWGLYKNNYQMLHTDFTNDNSFAL